MLQRGWGLSGWDGMAASILWHDWNRRTECPGHKASWPVPETLGWCVQTQHRRACVCPGKVEPSFRRGPPGPGTSCT